MYSTKHKRWFALLAVVLWALVTSVAIAADAKDDPWPPKLKGQKNGTVMLKTDLFLKIPAAVSAARKKEGAAPFVVAKTPPTVYLACHGPLPNWGGNSTGWTSWGDIGVAGDGKVYSGIGDHGKAEEGNAYCFIYQWDPETKRLKEVVDMNKVVQPQGGQPAWSKVHARIDEGPDGKIYFSCTLNDGNRAGLPSYKWTDVLPGGQLYQFDPKTGKTVVFANLPPKRCTATSILDRKRNIWWCNLEAGPKGRANALFALDLKTKKVIFQGQDGSVIFNRNFALANDGAIYFNAEGGIWKHDPKTNSIAKTNSTLKQGPRKCGGMRSSTRESKDGYIYGITYGTNELFRYSPAKDKADLLGPNFLTGSYTTVCVLSPDERFLYYLPGSHGQAFRIGTPVLQYEIKTGRQKVIAFLREGLETQSHYVPAGTYGVKMNADGSVLYVNFNGHPAEPIRPKQMSANGFGFTAFAAIHIPASER